MKLGLVHALCLWVGAPAHSASATSRIGLHWPVAPRWERAHMYAMVVCARRVDGAVLPRVYEHAIIKKSEHRGCCYLNGTERIPVKGKVGFGLTSLSPSG